MEHRSSSTKSLLLRNPYSISTHNHSESITRFTSYEPISYKKEGLQKQLFLTARENHFKTHKRTKSDPRKIKALMKREFNIARTHRRSNSTVKNMQESTQSVFQKTKDKIYESARNSINGSQSHSKTLGTGFKPCITREDLRKKILRKI